MLSASRSLTSKRSGTRVKPLPHRPYRMDTYEVARLSRGLHDGRQARPRRNWASRKIRTGSPPPRRHHNDNDTGPSASSIGSLLTSIDAYRCSQCTICYTQYPCCSPLYVVDGLQTSRRCREWHQRCDYSCHLKQWGRKCLAKWTTALILARWTRQIHVGKTCTMTTVP